MFPNLEMAKKIPFNVVFATGNDIRLRVKPLFNYTFYMSALLACLLLIMMMSFVFVTVGRLANSALSIANRFTALEKSIKIRIRLV